jgi:plastocyanin
MSITKNPRALRRWLLAVGVTLGSIGAVGCGGDDDDSASSGTTAADSGGGGADTTAAGGGGEAVQYPVDSLQYNDVSAPAGGTIDIENNSGAAHTFTADDGSFDVDYGADETATVQVPTEPGDYAFHCNIHSSMKATLTVE